MKSMTGYGRAQVDQPGLTIHVSIKSVNSRFLELRPHLPRAYQSLEIDIKKKVATYLLRGAVDVSVNRIAESRDGKVVFNQALAEQWLAGFEKSAKKLGLESYKDARILLEIPDFVRVEESQQIKSSEKKLLWQALDEALEQLDKSRSQEGKALQKAIEVQLKSLEKELQGIEKLAHKVKADIEKRLNARLESLRQEVEVDPQRLLVEVALQADKSDITEEVSRLRAHIQAVRGILKDKGSQGKRLDFFAQELLREVNTIGSKSSNAHLTERVVQAKSCIEKYREQVQNIQ